MQRVLIIGSGGAGKSTLARQLGNILKLPVIQLDAEYWNAGWQPTPKLEWEGMIRELIQQESWIMDGNYSGTMDLRLPIADTIIFLDMPRWLCLWRVVKRCWQYAGTTRPDMAADCPEQLTWEFIHWIWTYPTRRRDGILAKLNQLQPHQQVLIFRSPTQVRQFVQTLQANSVLSLYSANELTRSE
jgi:adenylate kinase family enzyme